MIIVIVVVTSENKKSTLDNTPQSAPILGKRCFRGCSPCTTTCKQDCEPCNCKPGCKPFVKGTPGCEYCTSTCLSGCEPCTTTCKPLCIPCTEPFS